jgi:hypothetical protein
VDDQRTATENKKRDVKMCLPDIRESELRMKVRLKQAKVKGREENKIYPMTS